MTAHRALLIAAVLLVPLPASALPLALPMMEGAPAPAPLAPPVHVDPVGTLSGLVTEDTILSGGEIAITNDVTVAPGVRLVLDRLHVVFHATPERHPVLRILPGASLEIAHSNLTNDPDLAGDDRVLAYYVLEAQGRVHLTRSHVTYAKSVDLRGPFASGSVIADNVFEHMAWSGVQATRGASVTIRDNVIRDVHFLELVPLTNGDPMNPNLDVLGGGVVLVDTPAALVAGNLFERIHGTGVIVAQSTGTGSFARELSGLIHGNVILAPSVAAYYADGGTEELRFENNAVYAGVVGALTAYGSATRIRGNDFLAAHPTALAGVWASGTSAAKASLGEITVTHNRFRGFDAAVGASDGASPHVRGNDFAENRAGARALTTGTGSPSAPVLDVRGNWWGSPTGPLDDDASDGSVPATNAGSGSIAEGAVDYSHWLEAVPRGLGPLEITIERAGARSLSATLTNEGPDTLRPRLSLHGAAAHMPEGLLVKPGESVTLRLRLLEPFDGGAVLAARHLGGAAIAMTA